MNRSGIRLISLPNEILFQILSNFRTKSLVSIIRTCQDLRLIGAREIQSRLLPVIARDDILFNLSLDTPQCRKSSPCITLPSSGLRTFKSNGHNFFSENTEGLHAQYLCLDLNSYLCNDPGGCGVDRGRRTTAHSKPDRTLYSKGIAEPRCRGLERDMTLEDFEDFGQFCIDLNIVIQKPASGIRKALVFHKGFIRIARSELDIQTTRKTFVGATSLSTHQSDQVFWVGHEPKVGLNFIANRQELVHPFPMPNGTYGGKTGAVRKFSVGIQELHVHMLALLVAVDELERE